MIHKCTLISHHVPGIENTLADQESRRVIHHLSDLAIAPRLFRDVDSLLGPHSIDLFASFQDRQLDRFVSREPQPEAQWVDAFSRPWGCENAWLNPPFSMIFRVLHKVRTDKAVATLLVPLWPAQPWFPMLMGMLVEAPLVLPQLSPLFVHPCLKKGKTPTWLSLVCRISGRSSSREASRKILFKHFSRLGNQAQIEHMTPFGRNGLRSQRVVAKIQRLATTLLLSLG